LKRVCAIAFLASIFTLVLSSAAHSDLEWQIGRDNLDLRLGFAQAILGMDFVSVSDAGSPLAEKFKSDPDRFDLRSISDMLESSPKDYNLRIARSILAFRELRPIPIGDEAFERREHDLKFVDEEWASLAVVRPDDPVPPYYRGLIAFELSQYAEAITHLEKAQRLGQSDLRILRLLAYLYVTTGDWDRTLAVSNRGVKDYDDSFLTKLQVLSLITLERYEDALRVCDAILGAENDPEISLLYASINLMIDRPAKAVEILEEMRSTSPFDKKILSLLLQARRTQNQTAEVRSLEELLRRNYPDDPKIRELLDKNVPSEASP